MQIGRVVGHAVSTVKHPTLNGWRLLIVQLLTESSKALDTSGSNVRRAEAQALHAEGMTMEHIAERFGVTRQRVSTLLRKARE